jgi:chromate transport protein ChrA
MDFSKQGITYILLIIPTIFACSVLVQGFGKLSKNEKDGQIAVGFGIFLVILIITAYILFIR